MKQCGRWRYLANVIPLFVLQPSCGGLRQGEPFPQLSKLAIYRACIRRHGELAAKSCNFGA